MLQKIVIGMNSRSANKERDKACDAATDFLVNLPHSDIVIIIHTHSTPDGTLLSHTLTHSQSREAGDFSMIHSKVTTSAHLL
jgi:hypothetical protein